MVSYAELLADRQLEIMRVVTADPDLAVRWVATSELPDPTPFFEGGEILLTTGLQTSTWTTEWHDYVSALCSARTVAIGFGSGLTYDSPPAELIEACRGFGLNLFEVPRRTPFVAVSHRVARLIAAEEAEAGRFALDVQRRLTAAAAKPDGEQSVMRALAQALNGAVAVVGVDGALQFGPVGARRSELDIATVQPELRRLRETRGRAAATIFAGAATIVLQPLGVGGRRSRFLVSLTPGQLSEGRRSAITTAVALLGLIDEQGRSAVETRRRLRRRAIELLIAGDPQTAALILDADPGAPALPRRVRMIRAAGAVEDRHYARSVLEETNAVVGEVDSELWLVCAEGSAGSAVQRLVESGLRVGVGRAGPLDAVGESHRTAGMALTQAAAATVARWDDLVRRGPLGLIDPAVAAEFSASFLGGLDAEQRTLLRCFLRNHGSHIKVAEELGVHRNTVRNRLDTIAAVLPGSLDDPQLRVSAWIALQSASAE